MSKLNKEILEAIDNTIVPNYTNAYDPVDILFKQEGADKIESICDDFAEKFAEWVEERKVSFSRNGKIKTKKELLQEFKQYYNNK